MLTFVFAVEVLSVRPDVEFDNLNIERAVVKVEAKDLQSAEDSVLKQFNVFTDFFHRGVSNIELIRSNKV